MAYPKTFRFLKLNLDMIILPVLIILASIYLWLEIGDTKKTWENTRVIIKCNDPTISHPIASEQLIFWKNLLITLGIAFTCFLEIEIGFHFSQKSKKTRVIKGRAPIIPFWRWITCFLIGLVVLLITSRSDVLGGVFFAPNLLAVCQPQLHQLCKPDSQYWVEVVCTTPVQMWKPAIRAMIPKMLIIYYYVMFTSLLRMIFKWRWMESKKMVCLGLFLQAINLALTVGVGVVSVYCNEAHSFHAIFCFVLIMFGSCVPTVLMDFMPKLIISAIKNEDSEKEELPRYWNDVLPNNNIIPQVYRPTTLLTPCGNQNPSLMGPGLKPQKDNYTDTPAPSMSIYPKLPTE